MNVKCASMDNSAENTEIYLAAKECEVSFKDCISQLPDESALTKQLTQDYFDRYDAWTLHLAVFASESLCLDHRLRNSPEIKSLVLQQLFVLRRNLVIATEFIKSTPVTDTGERYLYEDGGKAVLSAQLKVAFLGVEDALDRLHRLGIAIRQSSARPSIPRTKQYFKDEEVDSFEKLASTVLEIMYPSANPGLLEQIKGSLSLKYQRFLYLRGRGEQIHRTSRLRQLKESSQSMRGPSAHAADMTPKGRSASAAGSSNITPSEIISSLYDEAEAKRLYAETSEPPPHTASLHLGNPSCPPSPEIPDGKSYGTCSWCLENHPAIMFRSPREWRRHIERDWEPYVCISENCGANRVPPSFSTPRAWEKHMQESHSSDWSRNIFKNPSWICDIDHLDVREFSTEEKLVNHLSDQKQHPSLDPNEIQTVARRSVISPKRRPVTCPICCYDIENPSAEVSDAHQKSGRASGHVIVTQDTDNSHSKKNIPKVRFARARNTWNDHEQDPETRADDVKRSSQDERLLHQRMAKEVAGHLQTVAFRILSMYFLPPEPEVSACGDNSSGSWSGRLVQMDSSQAAVSVYQEFLRDSDSEDINPEYPEYLESLEDQDFAVALDPLPPFTSIGSSREPPPTTPTVERDNRSSLGPSLNEMPKQILSDHITDNSAEAELDRESIGTSVRQNDGWSSEHDSDVLWHSEEKYERPLGLPNRTKSDTTDLEDQTLNTRLKGTKSNIESVVPWDQTKVPDIVLPPGDEIERRLTPPFAITAPRPAVSEAIDLVNQTFYERSGTSKSRTSYDTDEDHGHLSLQDRLFDALVTLDEENRGFLPRSILSNLINEKSVYDKLYSCLSDTHTKELIRAYARRICEQAHVAEDEDDDRPPRTKSFKRVFAILVLIERTSSITHFIDEGVNDLDLPLVKYQAGKGGSRINLRLRHMQEKSLKCIENWTQFFLKAFEEWQWATISPFFSKGERKDVKHYHLQDSVILPFTEQSRRQETREFGREIEGGYSKVFRVKIHPDHHDFDLPQNQSVAIKEIHSQDSEQFNQEVDMLRKFSGNAHTHLISLFATYQQAGVYFLIFPWADGDLKAFWRLIQPEPSFDLRTVKWVAEQCRGIAHDIVKLHNYQSSEWNDQKGLGRGLYGRHGDLKPENILWFRDSDAGGGTLKITDFGLSEFSTNYTRSYKSADASISYRPPELDLEGIRMIGRSNDIWALGCLYLEFIAWLMGGWELIDTFAFQRHSFDRMKEVMSDCFFDLVKRPDERGASVITAMVKPSVQSFVQLLHTHELCSEFIHDFLDLIRFDMMIIKPNNPQERGRIQSDEVFQKLSRMVNKCEDPDYACKPAPWASTRLSTTR